MVGRFQYTVQLIKMEASLNVKLFRFCAKVASTGIL
jgi:hypothetical protein